MSDYTIEVIEVAEARPVRRALLHPTLPLDGVDYTGDSHPAALHIGAFRDGTLTGIASIHPQPMPGGRRTGAWRLRDIAVEHGHRGRGVGALLLERLLEHAQGHEGAVAWGRIRMPAFGFFERFGFSRSGGPIDDPEQGPQYMMWAEIQPLSRDWGI
jgi:GNAT superfamily N-acetyltransferase